MAAVNALPAYGSDQIWLPSPSAPRHHRQQRWHEDTMASLSVWNLDDDVLAKLKRRAVRHGRSAEAEARYILAQALSAEADLGFEDLAAQLRALTSGRRHTPAEVLLRESSEER
jgi:plasmid stability protein